MSYPLEIREILDTHNITEQNGEKLRAYFSNPHEFDPNRRTIIFSTPSRTGTSFFREELPLYAIATHYPDMFNLIYADGNINAKHICAADLIIAHRAGHLHDWLHTIHKVWPKTLKRSLVTHDVDDNEFNLPQKHSMKDLWYASGKDKLSVRSLKDSDCITTTGRKLQQTFRNFNKNVHIFRNMFDWKQPQWNLQKEKHQEYILIGWVGLTSHFEDIKKMAPIMKYVHDKYLNTKFVLSGMAIKDTEVVITVDAKGQQKFDEKEITDETKTYRHRVKQLFKDFDQNRIEFHDAVSLETYGKFYKDIDIGLAYLEHNTFNQSKSEIKVVEYFKYGGIPIFSNIGGYNDMYNLMPNDIKNDCKQLAINSENPEKWKETFDVVLNNMEQYKQIAKKGKEWVESFYDINKHVHERIHFYNNLIEEHNEKEVIRIQNLLV